MSLRLALLALLFISAVAADPIALTVTPAGSVRNLYRWQLLPGLLVQKPGDAIEVYRKAYLALREVEPDREASYKLALEIDELRGKPLAEVNRKRVAELVAKYQKPLDLIAEAARREQANWDFVTERLRKSGVGALLGELQEVREFMSILHLQARHHVLEDRPEKGVEVASTGFALARQMGDCPTLISHLVALALASISLDMLHDCVQHPKCPSLYGPLSDLPRPLVPISQAYEGERVMCYGTVPGLFELAKNPNAELPPETLDRVVKLYRGLSDDGPPRIPGQEQLDRFTLGKAMKDRHDLAKDCLRAAGYADDVVAKMPIVNAALLHAVLQYEERLGLQAVAARLPYPQAQAKFDEIARKFPVGNKVPPQPDDAAFPLSRFLSPAGDRILLGDLRLARRVELLRTAEALRQHATTTGKWPVSLADVKGVIVPNDPATLHPFAYKVEGDVAILDAPLPKPGASRQHELQLRLTLRKGEEKKP